MKTVGFCTVFIADMNSACKNTLVSIYLLNFPIRQIFDSVDFLKNLKISNFALFVFFSIYKLIFDDFFDNLIKSFSENLKQLTKMNNFLLFLSFHENRRILHCFHRRYEFCMQKYPGKCIFIEFLYKAKFRLILSKVIVLLVNQFSQKFENF